MRSTRSGMLDVWCECLSIWAWHMRSPEGGALGGSRGSACRWSLSKSAGQDAHMSLTMHAQHALKKVFAGLEHMPGIHAQPPSACFAAHQGPLCLHLQLQCAQLSMRYLSPKPPTHGAFKCTSTILCRPDPVVGHGTHHLVGGHKPGKLVIELEDKKVSSSSTSSSRASHTAERVCRRSSALTNLHHCVKVSNCCPKRTPLPATRSFACAHSAAHYFFATALQLQDVVVGPRPVPLSWKAAP